MAYDRERERRRLMRNNRRTAAKVQQLLTDQTAWNHFHPGEQPIDVNADGILSLIVAWLDQQYAELRDDVHPVSDPPPRLKKYLESIR